jgi:putative membrane protein
MSEHLARALFDVVIFSVVGIVVFAVAFFVIARISPFSLRKELEDDQNTALGLVIGSMIIGLSLIIGAAIHG